MVCSNNWSDLVLVNFRTILCRLHLVHWLELMTKVWCCHKEIHYGFCWAHSSCFVFNCELLLLNKVWCPSRHTPILFVDYRRLNWLVSAIKSTDIVIIASYHGNQWLFLNLIHSLYLSLFVSRCSFGEQKAIVDGWIVSTTFRFLRWVCWWWYSLACAFFVEI